MAEQLYKLSPDRDLQSYFLMPSAIAAMSSASSSGFTISGKWRQQFDWAVVEWNRDNTFEHPALRYLPDGDLSGLKLSYVEEREGCIPVESNLYPVVAWNKLRLWVTQSDGSDLVYYVNIADHATPVEGSISPASANMTLTSLPAAGSWFGLAFLEEHYYYVVNATDTLTTAAKGLADVINSFSVNFTASSNGANVVVTWNPSSTQYPLNGENGNRLMMYGFSYEGAPAWDSPSAAFSGGSFPTQYQISFDFGNLWGLTDADILAGITQERLIPTSNVRKLRWTWAADLQPGTFMQKEFAATISNWSVSGSNRQYQVAGPGSRRIEDSDPSVAYSGAWTEETGNYSGSKAHFTYTTGASVSLSYSEGATHELYVGLRRTPAAPSVAVDVDNLTFTQVNLALPGEDVLVRYHIGTIGAGAHTVTLTNLGGSGAMHFDFIEIVYPSTDLPDFPPNAQLSLATDWDTYHSQSLPAERTAWLIHKLGFEGRVNHYTGALWFYEIVRTGTVYASLSVQLNLADGHGSPYVQFALAPTEAALTQADQRTLISHLVLPDDNSSTVALAIAALINLGTNSVWASASGNQLTVTARAMGTLGNGIGFELYSQSTEFSVTASSNVLSGGIDGQPYGLDGKQGYNQLFMDSAQLWRTDLTTTNPINRAARDWHSAYFQALKSYGMDVVAAFSTELGNGDPSTTVGMAQCYPDGTPVVVNTPAVQTNFSPTATAYWTNVYISMATLQQSAGLTPYLQSGEVQWWYFPKDFPNDNSGGMTFYDAYTMQQFKEKYGTDMQTIDSNTVDPSLYPNEVAFLPTLIGEHTAAIRTALQKQFPGCRYEVLYPTDTNNTPLNLLVNYPTADWTPQNLTCLKTESFGFTGGYNLVNCTMSMNTSADKGFPNSQRSHLVGIGDAWSTWLKEVDIAQSNGLETVVLFALDQYCLIGYPPPPFVTTISSRRQG